MASSTSTAQQAYAKVLAKAWSDPAYKARLLANPAAALTELGVPVPKHRTLRVIEDTDSEMHVVLPRPPKGAELSDEALDRAVGGGCSCSGEFDDPSAFDTW
jgi:hypothetical protein